MDKPPASAVLDSALLRRQITAFVGATGIELCCVGPDLTADELFRALRGIPFLGIVMRTPAGKAACLEPILLLCKQASEQQRCLHRQGVCGLVYAAAPVVVEGSARAILLAGPVAERLSQRPDSRRITNQLGRWGSQAQSEKIRAAYCAVAVASLARVEGAVALLSLLIVHLLESPQRWLSAGNEHEPSCVASAKTFLKTHSLDESCLSDVARHVGLSGDYLGRIFRKATGATVGEYIARMRVERVKAMLPDPSCRIIEAAFAAGFQSVAQFNRVFKRYAGMSPSEYRSSLM